MLVTIKYYGWVATINESTDFAIVCRDNGQTVVECGQLSNRANWYIHPIYSAPIWFYDIISNINDFRGDIKYHEHDILNRFTQCEIFAKPDAHISVEF